MARLNVERDLLSWQGIEARMQNGESGIDQRRHSASTRADDNEPNTSIIVTLNPHVLKAFLSDEAFGRLDEIRPSNTSIKYVHHGVSD